MANPKGMPEGYTRTHIRWTTPEVGWLEFDAILRQSIDHDGEVTEHPVDTNSTISDHYRRITTPITLEATITNSPITPPLTHTGGAQLVDLISTITLPQPIYPGAPTTVGGFDITSKTPVDIRTRAYQDLDRVNLVYAELRAIQEEARILSVHLYSLKGPAQGGAYESMLLKRFSIDQDPTMSNAISLVLELKHIILAEVLTQDISGEVPTKAKKPDKQRSNDKKDAGAQAAKPATTETDRSVLDRLSSWSLF
jgi:hypothetical protein